MDLTPEEADTIVELNLIRKFKKGVVLLKEGELSNECFLVLKGCIRRYYLIEGEEKTTAFFTESQIATPVSYYTRTPIRVFLEILFVLI